MLGVINADNQLPHFVLFISIIVLQVFEQSEYTAQRLSEITEKGAHAFSILFGLTRSIISVVDSQMTFPQQALHDRLGPLRSLQLPKESHNECCLLVRSNVSNVLCLCLSETVPLHCSFFALSSVFDPHSHFD